MKLAHRYLFKLYFIERMVNLILRHFGSKLLLSIVSISVWISIISTIVSISSQSISIISIVSISISLWLRLSISRSLTIVCIWISISIGSVSVWSQSVPIISIPSISISISSSLWLSISRSLAIVVGMWESIVGVGMGVDMGSIRVGEWSIVSISISIPC